MGIIWVTLIAANRIPKDSIIDDYLWIVLSCHAAIALGKIGDKRAVDPLIQVLKGKDWPVVRCAAAGALGELGDKRAIGPLTQASNDSEINVRLAAENALKKINN